jgi:prepilin peptidase CpaA
LKDLQAIALLCVAMTAVLEDLKEGCIPNGIIVTGLVMGGFYQLFSKGIIGLIFFLGGVILPIAVLGGLYYFRMIGAGDIKLLCMAGGFLGPSACFSCIAAAVLSGGVISLVIMIRHHIFIQRLSFFFDYVSQYSEKQQWTSYLNATTEDAKFCFSVPVLLGILYQLGISNLNVL